MKVCFYSIQPQSRPIRSRVFTIGIFPPPFHGASIVTERYVFELEKALKNTPVSIKRLDTSARRAGTRTSYHMLRFLLHARTMLRLLATSRKTPTIVYFAGPGGAALFYVALLIVVCRARSFRVVFHHHSYSYITKKSLAMRAITRMLTTSDTNIFLTPQMSSEFMSRYRICSGVEVVSNAHFIPRANVKMSKLGSSLCLFHSSNLSAAKGTFEVLEIYRLLQVADPSVELVLAGPVSDATLRREIDELCSRAQGQVRYLGPLENDQLLSALELADFFLFPTQYVHEAEPLVVLEAMSRGVPVIATRIGSLPALLPEEWLAPRASAGAFVEVLHRLLATSTMSGRTEQCLRLFGERAKRTDLTSVILSNRGNQTT